MPLIDFFFLGGVNLFLLLVVVGLSMTDHSPDGSDPGLTLQPCVLQTAGERLVRFTHTEKHESDLYSAVCCEHFSL